MKKRLSVDQIKEGILSGDRNALSQGITLVESKKPEDKKAGNKLIDDIMSFTGKSIRVGITGAPGVGKSTFISRFGEVISQKGKRLAVLAIDPSSSETKGSIMGDKTRMTSLLQTSEVFVRPSPSGVNLGGVARKTRESMLLCEAAGFEIVIIETVGAGQSETAVKNMVDFLLLLLPPLGGDELQGLKKGIVEMADGIAITKCDGNNKQLALDAAKEYRSAIGLLHPTDDHALINTCSAQTNEGIDEIYVSILSRINVDKEDSIFEERRLNQLTDWMHEELRNQLISKFYEDPNNQDLINKYAQDILNLRISPYSAVGKMIN